MRKYLATVTSGNFIGREGYVTTDKPNAYGNIMWYSKEGEYPYRAVLPYSDIKIIKGVSVNGF